MRSGKIGAALAGICGAFVLGLSGPVAAEAGASGNARGQLYSTAAVNRFCEGAQGSIANTALVPDNILYDELGTPGSPFPPPGIPATGFIGSDALPYDGAEDLPLTTTQYVPIVGSSDTVQVQVALRSSARWRGN